MDLHAVNIHRSLGSGSAKLVGAGRVQRALWISASALALFGCGAEPGDNGSGATNGSVDDLRWRHRHASGGAAGTGGAATGGLTGNGGVGRTPSTGGIASTGGAPSTGGASTGGAPSTGGVPNTGGAPSTGGA